MRSASEVIDALGGSTAVASLLGLPATTVASWKSRNSIPVPHWPALISAGKDQKVEGLSYEALVSIHVGENSSPPTAPDSPGSERERQAS